MIKYDLQCANGHLFESWFRSSSDYDMQSERGLASCPVCQSTELTKRLMAPNIPAKSNKKSDPQKNASAPLASALAAEQRKMAEMIKEFRESVVANAEDVGERFADEARKIHYGETEERGIYGQATSNEAEELREEGIDVHPLPVLPEDRN